MLDEAGVDVIEVGYCGGSGSRGLEGTGPAARCDLDYLGTLPTVSHSRLAVMVVPTVCSLSGMSHLASSPVSMVRVASYPWNIALVPSYVSFARSLGLSVSVNIMAASYITENELTEIARLLVAEVPDVIFLADSFGAMNPDGVRRCVSVLIQEVPVPLGLHVHNNMGLASANVVSGLEVGVSWIDTSLASMARGAGNLATEQAVAFLSTWPRFTTHASVALVCEAADYVARQVLPHPMVIGRPEIAAGVNNYHYYFHDPMLRYSQSEDTSGRSWRRPE